MGNNNNFITHTKVKYKIPERTIPRMSIYSRLLSEFKENVFISSKEIALRTGFSSAQIRRDLTYFGQFGIPGKGYPVKKLKQMISIILGIDKERKVALIGMGNLGIALLTYKGLKEQKFKIIAAFDNDIKKINNAASIYKIQHINQLKSIAKQDGIEIAIITVPAKAAQEVVDYVIDCGIKLILNFAPIQLKVPDFVILHNIDVTIELVRLTYYAARGDKTLILKKTTRVFK